MNFVISDKDIQANSLVSFLVRGKRQSDENLMLLALIVATFEEPILLEFSDYTKIS